MKKYNLPLSKVVRHYDASRKNCPAQLMAGKDGLTWEWFVNELRDGSQVTTPPTPPTTSKLYRVRKSWSDSSSQKGAYSSLDNAIKECDKNPGYKVYDDGGNQVYPEIKSDYISRYPENGTAKVIVNKLNVRDYYSTNSNVVASYSYNETFKYNEVVITNDHVWVSYKSYSGNIRYVAVKNRKTNERLANCY